MTATWHIFAPGEVAQVLHNAAEHSVANDDRPYTKRLYTTMLRKLYI